MEAVAARVHELLSSTADKVELRSDDLPALIKIMESLTDDQIRDKALQFIGKSVLPSEFDQPQSELNGLLLAKGSVKEWMMKGLENNSPDTLKVWKAVIGLLGKTLHQPKDGTLLMNSLLQVVEKAFKHSDVAMRVQANFCWMALMDNFALNPAILTSPKRINLIVRPLIVSVFKKNVFHLYKSTTFICSFSELCQYPVGRTSQEQICGLVAFHWSAG